MSKKCIGCGVVLQNIDSNKEGYVIDVEDNICQRCFKLRNYNEYQKTLRNNDDYLEIINLIKNDDLVVYVTSLLDISLDYIDSFNNVIVVLTKRDILPKSVKDDKLINYIKERYNCLDVMVVSAVKNYNLDNLFDLVKKYNINDNVYIIGKTNSGKSTLINKLIKNYGSLDSEITSSMYPSTTLDKIVIKIDNLNIIDTPGLVNDDSIINYVDNAILKRLTIKKEIKPRTYNLVGKGSILIDELVRIDYNTLGSSMTIYINNEINIRFLGKDNKKMLGSKKCYFNLEKKKDIVISDLCFIKFTKEIELNIYSNDKILIYERDNLI